MSSLIKPFLNSINTIRDKLGAALIFFKMESLGVHNFSFYSLSTSHRRLNDFEKRDHTGYWQQLSILSTEKAFETDTMPSLAFAFLRDRCRPTGYNGEIKPLK
jgi:hypothetical protein